MIIIYAPPIKDFIDTVVAYSRGNVNLEDLEKARDKALDFSQKALGRFLFFSKSRVREPEAEEIYRQLRENLERRVNLLKGIDEVLQTEDSELLIKYLKKIEDVSFEVFGLGIAYREKQNSFVKLSPIPFFDEFLKLATAVNNDEEIPQALLDRMPLVIGRKEALEDDYRRLEKFYPEETDLLKNFRKLLDNLELGIGAIYSFTETGDKKHLMSGIRIISVISAEIYNLLLLIDETRNDKGFSSNPYLDYFLRAAKLAATSSLSQQEFQNEIKIFREYISEFFNILGEFKRDFVINLTVEKKFAPKFEDKKEKIENLISKLENIPPTAPNFGSIIKQIGIEMEELLKIRQEYGSLATQRADIRSFPEMADLQEAVMGVYKGVVTYTTLEEILLKNINRFQSLLTRVNRLPEDEKTTKIKQDLDRALAGISTITSFFGNYDRTRLAAGLEMLEKSAKPLEKAEEIIASYEKKGTAAVCPRCSFRNTPGRSTCTKCGTTLPVDSREEPDKFEVVVSESGTTLVAESGFKMREIETLEKLIQSIQSGEDVEEPIRQYIQEFTRKINATLQKHERFIKPIVEKYPENAHLQELSSAFHGSLESFRSAANEVSLYLIYHDVEFLKRGKDLLLRSQKKLQKTLEDLQYVAENLEAQLKAAQTEAASQTQ